jgi:hypothetical protein
MENVEMVQALAGGHVMFHITCYRISPTHSPLLKQYGTHIYPYPPSCLSYIYFSRKVTNRLPASPVGYPSQLGNQKNPNPQSVTSRLPARGRTEILVTCHYKATRPRVELRFRKAPITNRVPTGGSDTKNSPRQKPSLVGYPPC